MRLVINSKFKPFTYDEMVKPLVQYKEVFDKVEQDYNDLIKQTEVWKDIANQENSPEAYAMYKQYSDRLNALSNSFSKEGLKIGTRRSLLGMKRDYARDIVPIANAEIARKESRKYRQDVLSKDSSAIFKTNPTSLDDFLHGKIPDETFVSGDKIAARTAAKAEAMGKALFSDPQFKLVLGKQQYQIMQANGATPEQLFKAISQDPDAIPHLSRIFKDEWDAVDAESFGVNEQAAIRNYISTGMYAALAKPTYQFVANGEYVDAGRSAALALDQQRVGLEAARLNLARQEYADRKEAQDAARGQNPLWTRNGISYYSDGRNEQYVLHNVQRDGMGYPMFRVKNGATFTDENSKVWNSGRTFVRPSAQTADQVMDYLQQHPELELDPGNETLYGTLTPIINYKAQDVEGNGTPDPLKEENAGLQ